VGQWVLQTSPSKPPPRDSSFSFAPGQKTARRMLVEMSYSDAFPSPFSRCVDLAKNPSLKSQKSISLKPCTWIAPQKFGMALDAYSKAE